MELQGSWVTLMLNIRFAVAVPVAKVNIEVAVFPWAPASKYTENTFSIINNK